MFRLGLAGSVLERRLWNVRVRHGMARLGQAVAVWFGGVRRGEEWHSEARKAVEEG